MRRIENILYKYTFIKALIKNIDIDLEVYECSDKIKILEMKKREKEIQLQSIDNALQTLSHKELKIIEFRYFEKLRWKQISEKMMYSEDYLIKLKRNIITKLEELISI